MAQQSQTRPAAVGGRRAGPGDERGAPTTPAGVLLQRVVVIADGRAEELVAGLTAAGLGARVVSGPAVSTLIAGLAVVVEGPDAQSALEALAQHRRRGAAVAGLLLADDPPNALPRWLDDGADVVLPAGTGAAAVAAQLRTLARMLATEPPTAEPEVITVRGISIDLERREVRAGGQVVNLTPTEFRILAMLARKRGVVSHGELFYEIHGYDVSNQEAKDILKVHIWRLRAKLAAAAPEANPIVNVRGFGYLLERRSGRERRARAEEAPERRAEA